MNSRREVKEEIATREKIVRNAERELEFLQILIANNEQWVAELREELKQIDKP